jgi:molecular chaperone GrpE (heat shock protein)
MLTKYTELEFTVDEKGAATEDAIKEYDALCENGLINKVIAEFEEDYARANEVMNYVFQDNLAVNNTVESVIGKAATTLLNIVDDFANTLSNKVDEMNFDLADFDMSKLENIVNLLNAKK